MSQSFASRLAVAAGIVLALTAAGGLLGVLAPAVAGNARPHPALTGTLGTAAGIFVNNLWLLAVPFALCLLGYNADRVSRHTADLLVLVLVAVNALRVGVELGRWRGQLIPYVPQLPLEWTALAIAASVWLTARTQPVSRRRLRILAAAIVLLLATAAAVETWCTPHRDTVTEEVSTTADLAGDPVPLWVTAVAIATDFAPTAAGSLQGRLLPSPHKVRFRSAVWSAQTVLTTTTDSHKEGSPNEQRQPDRQPHRRPRAQRK